MEDKTYTIPEKQLFRLLTACSKINRCEKRQEKCECLTGIPKPTRKPRTKK